jgi:hypothetical protein
MTTWFTSQIYPLFKLYGFVGYQSRHLMDTGMAYASYRVGMCCHKPTFNLTINLYYDDA